MPHPPNKGILRVLHVTYFETVCPVKLYDDHVLLLTLLPIILMRSLHISTSYYKYRLWSKALMRLLLSYGETIGTML